MLVREMKTYVKRGLNKHGKALVPYKPKVVSFAATELQRTDVPSAFNLYLLGMNSMMQAKPISWNPEPIPKRTPLAII